jgi:hypothetical protein
MDNIQLNQIESSLRIDLPDLYKSVMVHYPFSSFRFFEVRELLDDPDELIDINNFLRSQGLNGNTWPQNYFCIGKNESGLHYYFDLAHSGTAVYFSDEEEWNVLEAHSLSEWIEIWSDYFGQRDVEMKDFLNRQKNKK